MIYCTALHQHTINNYKPNKGFACCSQNWILRDSVFVEYAEQISTRLAVCTGFTADCAVQEIEELHSLTCQTIYGIHLASLWVLIPSLQRQYADCLLWLITRITRKGKAAVRTAWQMQTSVCFVSRWISIRLFFLPRLSDSSLLLQDNGKYLFVGRTVWYLQKW